MHMILTTLVSQMLERYRNKARKRGRLGKLGVTTSLTGRTKVKPRKMKTLD